MSKYHSYLHTTEKIIQSFRGDVPLSAFLKQFFAQHKKYGSKDRKALSALCYQYYRVAHLAAGEVNDTICMGEFLCNTHPSPFLEIHRPEWSAKINLPTEEKLSFLQLQVEKLFPFLSHVSSEIDRSLFSLSFLKQPDVFLRVRPGKWKGVKQKLVNEGLPYREEGNQMLRLPAAVKVQDVLNLNHEAVVQDLQSARVLEELAEHLQQDKVYTVWDCCAASGGKSILMFDVLQGKMRLTVTDIRQGILQKLKERLQQARVPVYHAAVADVTQPRHGISEMFDIILCDAPCTGSGTWARTPEQLYFFNEKEIQAYQQKQQQIARHVWEQLKPGGCMVYITCSVFAAENEVVVEFISQQHKARLLSAQYLKGYELQADTLFAAVFEKLF